MATQTTNLLLNKPTVGADSDIWGGLLNDNADILEAAVLDKRTGGSITGNVSISGQCSVGTLVATGAISGDTVTATTSMTAPVFNGALNGNANTASTLQTARTISLSGDVAGSTSFNGGANVNISATIQPNSVALGTDTTGNYVGSVAAGSGITVAGADGEGVTKTVSHADTSAQASVNNAGNTFIQDVTLDGFGHVTGLVSATAVINDGTLTVSGGSGLTGSGSFTANQAGNTSITLNHADTSNQGSVNNGGSTVIQDVTLDGFGHVTGLASRTISENIVTATGGIAPYYAARIWASLDNGQDIPSLRNGANVSSVANVPSTGLTTIQVNFAVALPNTAYCVVCGTSTGVFQSQANNAAFYDQFTTSIKMIGLNSGSGGALFFGFLNMAIFN